MGYTPYEGIDPGYMDDADAASTDGVISHTDGLTTSVRTGFTNNRAGIIPTGLLLTVTPFVVGLFLFGALFFYMMARKRKEY